MREIKFRAWDFVNKIMDEDIFIDGAGNAYDYASMTYNTPNTEIQRCEFPVMQYTGLKDKNGVEIYEGDIDQAENGDKNVIVFLLKAGTYCVMPMDIYLNNDYQNEAFSQEFMYGFGYDLFFDNLTPGKYLNIIGNIYENPELLEGNQ